MQSSTSVSSPYATREDPKTEWTRIDNPYGIKPKDFQVGMIHYNIYEVRMNDRRVGTLHYWNYQGGQFTAYLTKGEKGPFRMSKEAAAIDAITYQRQKIEASSKPIKRRDRPTLKLIKRSDRKQTAAISEIGYRKAPELHRIGRAIAHIT